MALPKPDEWRNIRKNVRSQSSNDDSPEGDIPNHASVVMDDADLSPDPPASAEDDPEITDIPYREARRATDPLPLEKAKKGDPSFVIEQEGQKIAFKERRADVTPKLAVSVGDGEHGTETNLKIDSMQLTTAQRDMIVKNIVDMQRAAIRREHIEIMSTVAQIVLSIVGIVAGVMAIRRGIHSIVEVLPAIPEARSD